MFLLALKLFLGYKFQSNSILVKYLSDKYLKFLQLT